MAIPEKILIIGPGYVGAEAAKTLRNDGCLVETVSRSGDSDHRCDVSDLESVEELAASAKPDRVIHCAASGRGGGLETYRAVYLDGVTNLTTAFPGVPLLFTSSTSVYSQDDGSIVSEDQLSPQSETAEILAAAEKVVTDAGGTVLRLSGIYGPGRSIYLKRLLAGTAEIEDREPSRWLNQIHRSDIVGAIQHVLSLENEAIAGEVFNVTDTDSLTQRQCLEESAKILDLPIPPVGPPPDPALRKRILTSKRVSNAKLRATGWEPQYPCFLDAVKGDPELLASFR